MAQVYFFNPRGAQQLKQNNIAFQHYKDHVIFEKDEVLTMAGKPYGVFTPYKNMWLKTINDFYIKPYPVDAYSKHLAKTTMTEIPSLSSMGFEKTNLSSMRLPTGMQGGLTLFNDFKERMSRYKDARDFPAI